MDDRIKIGGRLIGTGSKSCVFTPNIPCKGKTKIDNTKISKLIYSLKSKKLLNQEKKINNKIRKIKNYKKWALIYDEYCKPDIYNKIISYDIDMNKCLKDVITKNKINEFNKNSVLLIGDYGGITFEKYFENHFSNITQNKLRNEFLNLMKIMKPLFLGLEALYKNNISHKDIKYNNIVIHDDVFKYIDFGLSSNFNEINHFKTRSLNEFNTTRIYLWYPLEYIYCFSSKTELNKELTNLYSNNIRRGHDVFYEIHNIFSRDIMSIYTETINFIQNNNYDKKNLFKKIDIYSLGILIPALFITKSNMMYPFNYDECIFDFYQLFREMTEPLHINRIDIKTAYKKYNMLIKKYS
jgi:serine/threonine protein kinase